MKLDIHGSRSWRRYARLVGILKVRGGMNAKLSH
ncbi:hypothetical protein DPMN_046209 [Dreissena polymorpha]|uniref:Uncharacterized protein n=1 Tax=Dreissena polymorpha TaxID=45954 RepID=A0A9D4HY05_DREPO|nr:hypothetical protein DPMN_046209 [Dreissena polymorpha]